MKDSDNRVLVIGGGIGGLSLALALQRVGIPVTVFERAPEVREVGAGLAVWANAIKALDQLGVGETLVAAGTEIHDYQFRTAAGDTLIRVSIDDLTRKVGAPSVTVRRSDVQTTLYQALEPGTVQLGCNCTGFTQDEEGVTAQFENGREERGTILIGADGIKSVTRAAEFGPGELRYSGYKCWRSITPFTHASFAPGSWWLLWGRGARFGLSYVGGGAVYWYAMVNAPAGAPDPEEGRKQRVQEAFRGWSEPVEALIEATAEPTILHNDLYDMLPMEQWGAGAVTLLGDAAHPTTPNMGQGACQAIEDSVILAKDLAMTKGLSDRAATLSALRRYEQRRRDRAARVTNLSWRIGAVGQWENPIACAIRDRLLKILPDMLMRKSLESNLAFDA
jgi:2-polyprenyl-6-methoxyphenol hydroxylase-like FAD-dependent oxidoreductase